MPTIRSVLAISDDIEVIVSDTSEVDDIATAMHNEPGWERVIYVRPPSSFTVVDNFNEGVKYASGDYVVFLGDDDLLSSEIIPLINWAKINRVDSIRLEFPIQYYWPDFVHKRQGDYYSGKLFISKFTGKVEKRSSIDALKGAMENFGGGVGFMPRAYAGIISRALVNIILQKYGLLFGGVSPDIYSSALISVESGDYYNVDYPVVIPGSSGVSTAGLSANGRHVGGLRDNAHIGPFKDLVWDDLIPEFYSVPTVWAYSLLCAIKKIDFKSNPSFERLYVRCLAYHGYYRRFTLNSMHLWISNVGFVRALLRLLIAAAAEAKFILLKVKGLVDNRLSIGSEVVEIAHLDSSHQASSVASDWLKNSDVKINYSM
ncbi:glycosyltransferase [Brachymonas sp. G13]|uniref:glycosyltransferase n=1 Tax=Brachymonas wangyanguii TaxID=3130163 RepID=UPI0038708531